MRFLAATVIAAGVSLSSGAFFGPNQAKVAFTTGRDLAISSLEVTLDTRGGASKKKKKKATDKAHEEGEAVSADQLYLPGLLDTVIRRTNKVGTRASST